ncbi:MAG: CoA transferase, partial [Candidatus Binatia bacterium]
RGRQPCAALSAAAHGGSPSVRRHHATRSARQSRRPRLVSSSSLPANAAVSGRVLEGIRAIVGAWVRERTCAEVLLALGPAGADVPCAKVARPDELIDDPQLTARGMIERHAHPGLGEILLHGNPLRFSDADARARALARPSGSTPARCSPQSASVRPRVASAWRPTA